MGEPLKLPTLNVPRTNSASLATAVNSVGPIGSMSVKSLSLQLQRGEARRQLKEGIQQQQQQQQHHAITKRNQLTSLRPVDSGTISKSSITPISSTSGLLRGKGGKYTQDIRYRAEVYAVNAILRDHENKLYDEFIKRMKESGASTRSEENGSHEEDDEKSTDSTVVPSPDNHSSRVVEVANVQGPRDGKKTKILTGCESFAAV